MGQTIIEKILSHNTGKNVKSGDIVTVNVDRVMLDDIMIPFIVDKFHEMGFAKVWDPDKVVLIYDHLVPASQQDDTRHFRVGDAFVEQYGIKNIHRSDGICHQLMTEAGYVKPGHVVFGTDSHTTTYGCVGAFSTGIGYTEMASILGTGTLWVKVPETIKVVIDGELPANVMSKDVILRLIGDLGADGATYRALEFTGSAVKNMSIASRTTMANMAIEAGAKNAIFPVDAVTLEYLQGRVDRPFAPAEPDSDAVYERTIRMDLSKLKPVVAAPHLPSNVKPVEEYAGLPVDQVIIGCCTNGHITDLRQAAQIMRGHRVAERVRCTIIPATPTIYLQAMEEGLLELFVRAGATVSMPTCGPCNGGHVGVLADGERCVSTTNRNFVGRMGAKTSEVYLASPAVAAACAVAGVIVTPEEVK